MIYSSEMSQSNTITFEDVLWEGLDENTFRVMTNKKGRTIAYGLWHSTRIEDITINILTEVFGIESLAKKIKDRYKDIEIIKLKEDYLEV